MKLLRAKELGLLIALGLLLALIVASGPEARAGFSGVSNIQNLSRQIALLTIFAIGETLVIVTAGIDLSIGSMIAFCGVLVASLMVDYGVPMGWAILIVLVVSGLVGVIHGGLITKARIAPFVVTLGSMLILRGFAQVLSPNATIALRQDQFATFTYLANGQPGGIPMPVLLMVAIAIPAFVFLRYTLWGRHLLALGGNEEAARLSGVNVHRVKTLAYVLCSLLAGLSGILAASYLRVGDPRGGVMYELRAIAAAVIGGASLMGGEGSVLGTILGACIFGVLYNGINIVIKKNASVWESVIVGAVVLNAALLDVLRQRRQRV